MQILEVRAVGWGRGVSDGWVGWVRAVSKVWGEF